MNSDSTFFSIIIVVRNGKDLIEDCVQSVINAECHKKEIILIDGASTDGTLNVVSKYAFAITKIVSEPDSGLYFAMNKAIALASGSMVGILGCDDRLTSHALQSVERAIEITNQMVYFGNMRYTDRPKAAQILSVRPSDFPRIMIPHPATFVDRRIYTSIGNFDTRYRIAADYDFILRATVAGYSLKKIDSILVESTSMGISSRPRQKFWSVSDVRKIRNRLGYHKSFVNWTEYLVFCFAISIQLGVRTITNFWIRLKARNISR